MIISLNLYKIFLITTITKIKHFYSMILRNNDYKYCNRLAVFVTL